MLQAVLLGLALLILVILGGRWFASANPHAVLRLLKWGGLGLAALALLALVVTGRLPLLLAAVAGLVPWLLRAMHVHSAYRALKGALGGRSGGWRNAGAAAPNTSSVDTRYLRMVLDHDSGELDGEVLAGPGRGRRLCQLADEELAALWRECRADPQSLQLLEAWLERNRPNWRDEEPGPGAGAAPSDGPMTRDEAWSVLGLRPGATPDEIQSAYKRLMMACHPDHGGSDWLASRLNQAKDMLLND